MSIDPKTKMIIFEDKKIRRIWHQDEWYFSVIDIVAILTDSTIPKRYWADLKIKLNQEGSEVYDKIVRLKIKASDGKNRGTDTGSTKTILRLIQSIPSPKAEPFKRWLAQVGYDRIKEIEDPELMQKRMKETYQKKGYPKDWIEKRIRGIAIRQNLTDEWRNRGIVGQREYSILTAEISKATFGMTPNQYKELKNIPVKSKINLRDNMTDLELIFSMLGERVTTEISQEEKPNTFGKNKKVAKRGGKVAGNARKETEAELGRSIISQDSYLDDPEKLM